MLILLVNTIFDFIHLLLTSLLTEDKLLLKFTLTITIITLIYQYYRYAKSIKNPNLKFESYKINNKVDLLFSCSLLCGYILIFIFGILYLRISNYDHCINLKFTIIEFYSKIKLVNIYITLINVLFIFAVLICYIILLHEITKYIYKHVIKLHIYLESYNIYTDFSFKICSYSYTRLPVYIQYKLYDRFKFEFKGFQYSFFGYFTIGYHLVVILLNLHYIVLINTFVYDMFYNDYTLNYTYKVLPFIFIYNMYIKSTKFYTNLAQSINADNILHQLIYCNIVDIQQNKILIQVYDKNYEPHSYDIELIRKVGIYLRYGLNGALFDRINEPDNIWLHKTYSYFQDWKYRKDF